MLIFTTIAFILSNCMHQQRCQHVCRDRFNLSHVEIHRQYSENGPVRVGLIHLKLVDLGSGRSGFGTYSDLVQVDPIYLKFSGSRFKYYRILGFQLWFSLYRIGERSCLYSGDGKLSKFFSSNCRIRIVYVTSEVQIMFVRVFE